MADNGDIICTGRWSVGLDRTSNGTLLRFDFTDAPPLTLLVPENDALKIADAIREQYANKPPERLS